MKQSNEAYKVYGESTEDFDKFIKQEIKKKANEQMNTFFDTSVKL